MILMQMAVQPRDGIKLPRDGIKFALLDFATQYGMLACGMCLEWAPRLFRYGVTKPGPGWYAKAGFRSL